MVKRSQDWINEHESDPFVAKARKEGYVSRAAYKLLAIQEKDKLLKKGMTVVDLGAAPGGWCQVAKQLVGDKGLVVAMDRLPMKVSGFDFVQGDFTHDETLDALLSLLADRRVDVVLSDMAPNLSGIKGVDLPKAVYLIELALDLACKVLRPGGDFLFKIHQGEGVDALVAAIKKKFKVVLWRKPDASRARSREVYVLARSFIG